MLAKAENMVLKFYDFYCRKPSFREFMDFIGMREAFKVLNKKCGYSEVVKYEDMYKIYLDDICKDLPRVILRSSTNRCYNVYDGEGNFYCHGDYARLVDMIPYHFNDIGSLSEQPIRILRSSVMNTNMHYFVMARKYNKDVFLDFVNGKGGYELDAIEKDEFVKMLRKAGFILYNSGRLIRKPITKKQVTNIDEKALRQYKEVADDFMDLYNRFPTSKDLDAVGITREKLKDAGFNNVNDFRIACGYEYLRGTRTFGVYTQYGEEEYRGTRFAIMEEYGLTENMVYNGARIYKNENQYIRLIPFSVTDFNDFRHRKAAS